MRGELAVSEEPGWSTEESAAFDDPLIDYFAGYAASSTDGTAVAIAKVRRDGRLVGVAPVVRIRKYRTTRLLAPGSRRWMDPLLGPFARKTVCFVDTSLMGFRYEAPFFALDPADGPAVRAAVIGHLQSQPDIDTLCVSEPWAGNGAGEPGFTAFLNLPLAVIDLAGCASFDAYLERLSRKRRKNARQERKLFADAGARIEAVHPPYPDRLVDLLHGQLMASARRNEMLEVPYGDVMNAREALERQAPHLLLATIDEAVVGFIAFLVRGTTMHQCHGGLDYARSAEVKAYPNLMHGAVDYAISNGLATITLGPVNNEAKRRASEPLPVVTSFWCSDGMSAFFMKYMMMKRFQVYTGPAESARSRAA